MVKSKKRAAEEGANSGELRKIRKPRGPVTRIDNETFVRLWVAGKSATEIAETVGASIACVRAKAMTLRKKGVNLPRAATGRTTTGEIQYLNSIIRATGDGCVQGSLLLEDEDRPEKDDGMNAEYEA